ncbi:hypothetical protein ACKLNO_02325 [Neisseriaceae bacterium B1]
MLELLWTIIEGIGRAFEVAWGICDLWCDTKREYRENKKLSRDTWIGWIVIMSIFAVCFLIIYWAVA